MSRIPVRLPGPKRQKVPESGVLRACLDLLTAEKIWHERRNTGGMKGEYKGRKRFIRFSKKGTADILAIVTEEKNDVFRSQIVWIEAKSDIGEQSPAQIEFEREVTDEGHTYLLCRSSDDLKFWLQNNGVIK